MINCLDNPYAVKVNLCLNKYVISNRSGDGVSFYRAREKYDKVYEIKKGFRIKITQIENTNAIRG